MQGWLSSFGGVVVLLLAASLASAQTTGGTGGGTGLGLGGGFMRTVPTPMYFSTLALYYDGDYRAALGAFLDEGRGSIKSGANRWIDAICYHTMAGDCYYQLGQHNAALNEYTAALQLYVAFNNWMIRVQFDPAVRPGAAGSIKVVPWGQSKRTFHVGSFKDTTLIGQGQINNNQVVMQGGVVQQAVLFPINVQEIVRCTAQAMRRRRELLGPLAPHDVLANECVAVLTRRPGQPNHWSEAWIDLQLGMAFAQVGKDAQARTSLERAIVAGGEYDHPLTAMALLELGRLALVQADFSTAARYFDEATYTAVNFFDPGILEEAFRYGFITHLVSGSKGLFPPLVPAVAWAKRTDERTLGVSLMTMLAENAAGLGETQVATNWINEARAAINRHDLSLSKYAARLNLVTATVLYQSGQLMAGDTALAAAMNFQRNGSLWLFHIALVDRLLSTPASIVSPRVAMDVYNIVLRDPQAPDWLSDPLESLAVTVVPHHQSYENWFNVAIDRKEYERALEISDLAKRHRFNSAQEIGGRLVNLRWLLESPLDALDQTSALERQDILLHYPGYEQLSQKALALRADLLKLPLAPDTFEGQKAQAAKLEELSQVSAGQEMILREIAVRREPCKLLFPPTHTTKELQESLPEHAALLAFFCTSQQTHAFLMTNDKYGYWPVAAPQAVLRLLTLFLRELGNFEQNKELRVADLQETKWKKSGAALLDMLMKDSKIKLPYGFQEMIIVPDSNLWYVPFEALEVSDNQGTSPLIHRVKLRYAPTMGLGIPDKRPRNIRANLAVVLGRMYPNDDETVSQTAFADFERVMPEAVPVKGKLTVSSSLLASLFDRMVVLSDSPATELPLAWSPVPLDQNQPGSSLGNWLSLPWGGPDQVVIPGFHSSAENALKHNNAGVDMFQTVTGLMASGARTVLISRWRAGGQSSVDLVREFVQELPHTTADDAWQRSVLLVGNQPLNVLAEPRVNKAGMSNPPNADHPFFWSGFLLADTGAKPQTDEPPAAEIIKAKPPAGAKAAPAAKQK